MGLLSLFASFLAMKLFPVVKQLVCGYLLPGGVVEAQRKAEVIVEGQGTVGVKEEVQRKDEVIVEVQRKEDVIPELITTLFYG
jgi:hypothetical protein